MPEEPEPTGSRRRSEEHDAPGPRPRPTPPERLWDKLRDRGIVHLSVVYVGVAWASVQVIHLFIEREVLPPYTFYLALVLLTAGFPVALVLAWVQDRPHAEEGTRHDERTVFRWMVRLAERIDTGHILVALGVVVGGVGLGWLLLNYAPPFATASPEGERWTVMTLPFDPGDRATPDDSEQAAELGHVFDTSVEWILDVPVVGPPETEDADRRMDAPRAWMDAARRAGARYLVTGNVFSAGAEEHGVTVRVYDVVEGRRLVESGSGGAESPSHAVARLATEVAELIAEREALDVGAHLEVAAATSSPVARLELMTAQRQWWSGDYERAAASFRRAIAADSGFAPAYLRLSVLETFRWDYPSALAVVDAGLRRRAALGRKWTMLLEAQERYLLHDGEGAIRLYQQVAGEYPESVDAWLGLSESLLHYAGPTGRCQVEALPAFRRLLEADSTFAPTRYHLVHLHLLRRDEQSARRHLAAVRPLGLPRKAHALAVDLVFGDSAARAEVLAGLAEEDRNTISSLVFLLTVGSLDLSLADTVAAALRTGPGRTASDRERAAQYQLVARAGLDRWADAVSAWRPGTGGAPLDRFLVEAYLAGFPADSLAAPMFAWAEDLLEDGRIPDYSLPVEDDRRQGWRALVHRAATEGDSARVELLLGRLGSVSPEDATAADPLPGLARAALEARLMLMAHDTARAVSRLEDGLRRLWQVETGFYPLTSMAAERALLAELHLAMGHPDAGRRWLRSLFNTWSLGDALYRPGALRLASRHDLPSPLDDCSTHIRTEEESFLSNRGAQP